MAEISIKLERERAKHILAELHIVKGFCMAHEMTPKLLWEFAHDLQDLI